MQGWGLAYKRERVVSPRLVVGREAWDKKDSEGWQGAIMCLWFCFQKQNVTEEGGVEELLHTHRIVSGHHGFSFGFVYHHPPSQWPDCIYVNKNHLFCVAKLSYWTWTQINFFKINLFCGSHSRIQLLLAGSEKKQKAKVTKWDLPNRCSL